MRLRLGSKEEQPRPKEAWEASAGSQGRTLDPHIEEQFGSGRLLACISSRPGQCGRADGYAISEFYFFFIRTFICLYNQHPYCSIKWSVCL